MDPQIETHMKKFVDLIYGFLEVWSTYDEKMKEVVEKLDKLDEMEKKQLIHARHQLEMSTKVAKDVVTGMDAFLKK